MILSGCPIFVAGLMKTVLLRVGRSAYGASSLAGLDPPDTRRRFPCENVNRFVMIRKILPGSSARLRVFGGARSFDATVRWCIASESEAGARNNWGAVSWARNDGDADISWRGFRTMRGGARKKHISSPNVVGEITSDITSQLLCLPLGPNTPCDVLGSASVLSFRSWEYATSSLWAEDALRP